MLMKKLSIARNQLKKSIGEIPIKWGRYINKEMQEQKVFFFGHEKAIYGSDGDRLDEKLIKIEDGISDAFTESKDYAIGDYCIYLNSLYRFTAEKPAGAWDGAAVVPVSIAGEIGGIKSQIDGINSGLDTTINELSKKCVLEWWNRPANLLDLSAKCRDSGIRYIHASLTDTSIPGRGFYQGIGFFGIDKRTIVLFEYNSTKFAVNSKHDQTEWTGWKIYQ